MIPIRNDNHKVEARGLFTSMFRNRRVIQALSDSYINRLQDLEALLWDMYARLFLDTAVGDQLDKIGSIVGEPRRARTDDLYRPAIRLRIRVNRSQGLAEDVLQVAQLSDPTQTPWYKEVWPAGFYVRLWNLSAATAIAAHGALGKTRAAGTRGVFLETTWPTSENFVWGSRAGTVANARGFGSRYDTSYVSRLADGEELTP